MTIASPAHHATAKRRQTGLGTRSTSWSRKAIAAIGIVLYAALCAGLLLYDIYLATLVAAAPAFASMLFVDSVAATRVQIGAAWVVLFVAAAPWQMATTAIDTGAVDTGSGVTAIKVFLTAAALGLAALRRRQTATVPLAVKILLAYALVVAISGVLGSDPDSSTLRAVRLAAVVVGAAWLASHFTQRQLVLLVVSTALIISVLALGARWGGIAVSADARLAGYLPPLHPNGLGLIAASSLLCATALLVRRQITLKVFVVCVAVLGTTVVLTQSRTSVLALIVGLLALSAPGMRAKGPAIVYTLVAAFLVAGFVQTFTTTAPLTRFLTHNGSATVTGTLGTRQSAWRAAWDENAGPRRQLLGDGLASKSVEINLASARFASVDGTWPAAYLSAGIIGVLVLAAAIVSALRSALRRRDSLAVALCAFLLTTSVVVSVFNDITAGLLLLVSLVVPARVPSEPDGESS